MGLAQPLLQAVEELGFVSPTPVQEKVIPLFLHKASDILALAQTGTGKTAAFGLPLIQHLDTTTKQIQALVLSPTRELCVQIANDLKNFSKYIPDFNVVPVYGGSNISSQIKDLRRGAHVVVATPGRLMDLIDREAINLSNIKFLILDEADEMLNMGFEEDVRRILTYTPEEKNIGLFSATMPSEIRAIANEYLQDPVEVAVGKKNAAQQNIEHKYSMVQLDNKYEALKRLLDFYPDFYGIIFCGTKIQTQEVSDALVRDGYPADCLHGDLGQSQRDKVMNHFRHRTIKILLATDVAARGIDVNNLTHVLHYQLPQDIESYTHRSGRTARAGRQGVSIAMILPRDQQKIARIERQIQAKFEYLAIPQAAEVRDRKLSHFINTIASTEIEEQIFDEVITKGVEELEQLEKRDLVMKMLSLELRRFSMAYLDGPDLNVYPRSRSSYGSGSSSYERFDDESSDLRGKKSKRYDDEGGDDTRIFINMGSVDKVRYDEMREFLYKVTGVKGKRIRDIEMKDTYSFFNTDAESAEAIYQAFKTNPVELKGRALRVDYAQSLRNKGGNDGGGERKRSGSFRDGGRKDDRFGGKRDGGKSFEKRDYKSDFRKGEKSFKSKKVKL